MVQPKKDINATLSAAEHADFVEKKPSTLSIAGWKYAIKRVIRDFFPDGLLDLGALLTYYSVLSLAPALLVAYSLITLFLASETFDILDRIKEVVQEHVSPDHSGVVLDIIDAVAGSASAGRVGLIIGVLVALWSASSYVRAFSRCANAIYGRTEGRFLIKHWLIMVTITLGLLLGAIVIVVSLVINETLVIRLLAPIAEPLRLTGVVTFLTDSFIPMWNWLKWPVILLVLMMLVATLYHVAPNIKPPKFRLLSPGSVFAIVGILTAGWVLGIYFSRFATYSSYGAVGSVMALFFGLWVFNILLVVGVKIDAELSRARQLQAGLPAEEHNLLPPRSTTSVVKKNRTQQLLNEQARELMESYNSKET